MKKIDVIKMANALIKEHGEVTVRQIYYQLYPKHNKEYSTARSFYNSFDQMLVRAREDGDVDPSRVIDTARTSMGGDFGEENIEEYLNTAIDEFLDLPSYYTRRRWDGQDVLPVVWIEKDALSRIVNAVAKKFRVETCPSRGYSSLHYLREKVRADKRIKLLHFSDHDPSGLDMFRDLKIRARKYAEREVPAERISLTYEQVKQYNLPANPTKRADTRRENYVGKYGDKCWELDALPPDVLKLLVEKAIRREMNVNKWRENLAVEKREKSELDKKMKKFKDAIEKVKL